VKRTEEGYRGKWETLSYFQIGGSKKTEVATEIKRETKIEVK
jgi:hypothetical protein